MDLSQFSKNPEQIRGLIALLESMLPKENAEDAIEDEDKQATPIETKAKKRSGKQIKKKPAESKNKFSSMPEFNMHKDDSAIDKRLAKIPPTARMRESISYVDATCRICGKRETISSSLVFESLSRYKCNSCATQAG